MSNPILRIVDRNMNPDGWAVRNTAGGLPMAVYPAKQTAVNQANSELVASTTGGQLWVYDGAGIVELNKTYDPAVTLVNPAVTLGREVKAEGKVINQGLKWSTALLGLLPVSVLAPFFSPAFQEVPGTWWGVFFATFAWSAGVCVTVWAIASGRVTTGRGISATIIASLVVTSFVANAVGLASLDTESAFVAIDGNPWVTVPLRFVGLAFVTYGYIGTLLGGGVGCWLGLKVAKYTTR
jgi:hypothetical protein